MKIARWKWARGGTCDEFEWDLPISGRVGPYTWPCLGGPPIWIYGTTPKNLNQLHFNAKKISSRNIKLHFSPMRFLYISEYLLSFGKITSRDFIGYTKRTGNYLTLSFSSELPFHHCILNFERVIFSVQRSSKRWIVPKPTTISVLWLWPQNWKF